MPSPQTNDLSGIWDCTFDLNLETPFKAIAEWSQDGNHLTGTFRTETGDYRYLDGTVSGDKFFLSCLMDLMLFYFLARSQGTRSWALLNPEFITPLYGKLLRILMQH
ncbi:MAG: hypothetical protein IPI18_22130 [Saprospiraceae bacterium]|nr:hypothetical protein [Saprospiraceae bacterium]